MATKKKDEGKVTQTFVKHDEEGDDVKVEAVQVTVKNAGDVAAAVPGGVALPDGGPDGDARAVAFDSGALGRTEAVVGEWIVERDGNLFVVSDDRFQEGYKKR